MKSVFFFAHQDDEFGVFASIEKHVKNNDEVLCYYITDGGATATPEVRNQESLSVLTELGVEIKNIVFLGEELDFKDSQLHKSVQPLFDWLTSFFHSTPNFDVCYVPALEGGHPDHDVLHTMVVSALSDDQIKSHVLQYPLYNARNRPSPFFQVLTPIAENGPVEIMKLTFSQKCRYLTYCFRYRSQWKTWVGLTPFVFLHLFFRGKLSLQNTSVERLGKRPHPGTLYFEARNFLEWDEFENSITSIIK
ncbi:MAG: PIG-L family deacetylase [Lentilitoribacter sp.]